MTLRSLMTLRALSFFIVTLFTAPLVSAEFVVSHRVPAQVKSSYYDYYIDLLKLALEKTRADYGDYRFEGFPSDANTLRGLNDVVQNLGTNLVLEMAYDEKLTESGALTYIEVPVDAGIVGYRVCYINPALESKITTSTRLDDLKKYTIGQGVGWADSAIFRHNGFKVIEVDLFSTLFKMVAAGRFDLFCRGANQLLEDKIEGNGTVNLVIDKTFVLEYPLPRFFYINSKNQLAKARIEAGLKMAFADGSFKRLWLKHYKESLDYVGLKQRQIFHLENPLLKNLSSDYKKYFFDPY